MELQKTHRRWFRFRLRTLLIMVMFLSVPLGWVGLELDQRLREKPVAAWVEKMGGQVGFASYSPVEMEQKSWWDKTTDKWFGETLRVAFVRLEETPVSDLSPLAELNSLKGLRLRNTEVSDLSPLAELRSLKLLDLSLTDVNDLSPLAELKNLEYLILSNTQVSDLSPLAGLENLESLVLNATRVSDLSPLAELKNLGVLFLDNTSVSEEQVEELRRAIPNCEIRFGWTD